MSRIGKLPIKIPAGVNITNNGLEIIVKGKFGTLQNQLPDSLSIQQTDSNLIVTLQKHTREGRALHGLYRTLINNMVIGVSEQFQINLNLKGVGYRAAVQGKSIILNLGYSHPIEMEIPEGISVEVVKNVDINLKGCDKEQLGLFAAKIRAWRLPEPYKGKGIIYEGEIVKRKAGKSGKK
uniref:Large ribosomal subunit protein uL6c n=2 Tax=Chaetoceros TaxID=49237 RepID=A0A8K1ZQ46_9STRA|nr:ribosomal protein L6 [Chaetoceros muellerii]QOK36090.1 ribosomal protein L6 [Chaetoceros muellerii]UHB41419.1 ribosomal protein L6 [Chaetoceros sp. DS1]